jgi:hypothetical protein
MPPQLATRRVVTLLNAISDLHEGDLQSVLGVDGMYDHEIYGDAAEFRGDLGRLLEDHLMRVMCFGESSWLDHVLKPRGAKKRLGNLHWTYPQG